MMGSVAVCVKNSELNLTRFLSIDSDSTKANISHAPLQRLFLSSYVHSPSYGLLTTFLGCCCFMWVLQVARAHGQLLCKLGTYCDAGPQMNCSIHLATRNMNITATPTH